MTLEMLLKDIKTKTITGRLDTEIKGLSSDSRSLASGDLFVAIKGENVDGHDFISNAVKRGAAAVVYEDKVKTTPSVPFIQVEDTKEALACISNNFYRRPSESLVLLGVTGTNGKTTTTYLIKSILEAAGNKVGLIGTINYMIEDHRFPAPFTTPDAIQFQRLLRQMLDAGCSHVVSEVSSHALAQKRVDCTVFKTAVFTNLTRDHLDFHADMEDYFKAKARLFERLLNGRAVINLDDPYGRRLCSSLKGDILTYGIESDADFRAYDIKTTAEGVSFMVRHSNGSTAGVKSSLLGTPNVYNILSAIGASFAMGIPWEAINQGIRNLRHVEGRFEKIDLGQDFLCILDYAHTEDALKRLILTAREITAGRIITVFGCGGQRDRGKRPAMGAVATELSDLVFITSDNPRGEDPEAIIKDIETGVKRKNYQVIPDRRQAITEAIMTARTSDLVLIAGKGHEDYQEIKGVRHKFSDREAAADAIKERIQWGH